MFFMLMASCSGIYSPLLSCEKKDCDIYYISAGVGLDGMRNQLEGLAKQGSGSGARERYRITVFILHN